MAYQDRTLTCVDCGSEFVFTAADQEFHAQKGYANEPKRCPSCRSNRRATLGGRPGGSGFGDNREWSQVTCSRCGQQTQVPFVPRTDRPVYCSDCFSKERAGSGTGGGFGGGGRSRY